MQTEHFQHIDIHFSAMQNGHMYAFTVHAIEWKETGLGIQRLYNSLTRKHEFRLVHLASGFILVEQYAVTLIEAAKWLRGVRTLFDWKAPLEAFTGKNDLLVNVYGVLLFEKGSIAQNER